MTLQNKFQNCFFLSRWRLGYQLSKFSTVARTEEKIDIKLMMGVEKWLKDPVPGSLEREKTCPTASEENPLS